LHDFFTSEILGAAVFVMDIIMTNLIFVLHDVFISVNKRQRIPRGQSKMDNPEKLAT